MATKNMRWVYVILGIIMFLCLGTVYSWSVFRESLEVAFQMSATESGLPYMVCLACYALWMFLTGPYIEKYPPRSIMIIGGMLVGGGWLLASYSESIISLTITYGVITGSGVGMIYGIPVAVISRWFPEKKGLAVGLILGGFGMSPLITAPLAERLIALYGPLVTFRILGIVFLIVLVALAIPFKFPPDTNFSTLKPDIRTLFSNKKFYGLWICFALGTLIGLMAIGITSPVAKEVIQADAHTTVMLVSAFALCNGLGRPLFGWMTDRIGPMKTAIVSYCMIIMASALMIIGGKGSIVIYSISFGIIWMTLGSWLAIAPIATGRYFGSSNQSRYYGVIFLAYGVGALLGVSSSGMIKDVFGSYYYSFYYMLLISLIGIGVATTLLREGEPIRED